MRTIVAILAGCLLVPGCSDDSTGTDNNNNNMQQHCGNGMVDDDEECDGADLNGHSCESLGFLHGTLNCSDCRFDTGHCSNNACGDGVIDPHEDCEGQDLGFQTCETLGYDGGTLTCRVHLCLFDSSDCHRCGDGTVNGPEECDGTLFPGPATCLTEAGHQHGSLSCTSICTIDNSGCHTCGNGTLEGPETCDSTNLNSQSCLSQTGLSEGALQCQASCLAFDTSDCHECGNGIREGPEACDASDFGISTCQSEAGHADGTLTCLGNCTIDTSDCYTCGDGNIDGPEVCDGQAVGTETCQDQSFTGGVLICNATCNGFDTVGCFNNVGGCGNGLREFPEQCDATDLGGADCVDWGFTAGSMDCNSGCSLDFSGCTGDSCQEQGNYGDGLCDPCELMGGTADSDCNNCGSDGNCVSYIHTSLFMTTCMWATGSEDPDCGTCGNGVADINPNNNGIVEWCDATDMGLFGCTDFGYIGGTIGCTNDCLYDLSGCGMPQCGNDIAEGAEECDGTDLRNLTCQAIGYSGGSLGCNNCTLVTSGCTGTQLTCPTDDGNEDNDDYANATAVSPPVSTGGIICTGDSDFFSFSASEGDTISVNLAFVHSVGDLDLYLDDPNQTNVEYSAGVTDGEQINYLVPTGEGGTYYVEVAGFSGAEAAYGLDINVSTPTCGDNLAEGLEVCDGTDLNGLDCTDFAFTGGTLGCAGDCSDYNLSNCTGGPELYVQGPGLGLALTDDGYDGTQGSMNCVTVAVPSTGSNTVADVGLRIGMAHTWIGDLVIKLVSPTNTVLTVMSRPGLAEAADDGTDCCGNMASLATTDPVMFRDPGVTDAETMGALGGVVCQGDGLCDYFPNSGAGTGTNFADFNGENAVGDWLVCFGDSASGDLGTVDAVTLMVWKQ